MRIDANNFFGVVLGLGAMAVTGVALTAFKAQSDEYQQQMELVRSFYRDYLSVHEGQQRPPASAFYSPKLIQLLDLQQHLCDKLSRAHDSCNDNADPVLLMHQFTHTVEPGAGYDFDKAGLEEVHVGNNTIDILVKPRSGQSHTIPIGLRYLLIKQADGWRVNNILFSRWGVFSAEASLRSKTQDANESMLRTASDISYVASEVFRHLSNKDKLNDSERYIKFPVQLCGQDGHCATTQAGDHKVRQAIAALHAAYHNSNDDTGNDQRYAIPLNIPPASAVEGKVVALGALAYTFQDQAWWITKIDLSNTVLPKVHHANQ